MAKLVRINTDNTRDTVHEVPGVGTSQRRKHLFSQPTQEFFAVRLLKRPEGQDQTEYFVELSREEAQAVYADLDKYLDKTTERFRARFGGPRP